MQPDTRYADSGGVNIAYQVLGEGPRDLVFVPGWVSNIEVYWEEPALARALTRLSSFSCLILFDKRGTGLSDRVADLPSRIAALAAPGEVLVSSTVKDLVAGSGLSFRDRGASLLKGVSDEWRLYSAEG